MSVASRAAVMRRYSSTAITELVVPILDGLCVYDRKIVYWDFTGEPRSPHDSCVFVCFEIDKCFFNTVVVPTVWSTVSKLYPASRMVTCPWEGYPSPIEYSGRILITCPSKPLITKKEAEVYWDGYPKQG